MKTVTPAQLRRKLADGLWEQMTDKSATGLVEVRSTRTNTRFHVRVEQTAAARWPSRRSS